ncbi:MAG: response regulator [Acidobacteriota bacterium]|nr:MAG: response regulator [Acidobacteriota bacterium]
MGTAVNSSQGELDWKRRRSRLDVMRELLFPASGSQGTKVLICCAILLGIGTLAYSLYGAVDQFGVRWLPVIFLSVLSSNFTFTLPTTREDGQSISVAMGDVFVFLAIILFGPEVASLTAAAEGLTLNLRAKVAAGYKQLFNVSIPTVAAYSAGLVFYLLADVEAPLGVDHQTSLYMLLFQLGLSALLYFALNTGFISLAMLLRSGGSLYQIWKENFVWTWVTQAGGVFVVALTFHFLGDALLAVILVAPTILLLFFAYKVNVDRIRQTQLHLKETRTLLAEKTRAEEALQQAKEELELRVAQRTADLSRANEQLVREIEERIQAEEALAAEKDRLAVTLRSIGDGVITADIQGRVVLLNKAAEIMTGWGIRDARGRQLEDVFRIFDRRSGALVSGTAQRVLETGKASLHQGLTLRLVSADRKERLVSHSVSPIVGKSGRAVGVVLVFRDITVQKRMEDELLKAQKLESLGLLAGGIAHDFNNILAAILMKSQMGLRALDRGATVGEYLGSISDAAKEASDLTQQLLTFAKGGAPIKKQASIRSLLMDSTRFSLRGSEVRCDFEIQENLWAADFDSSQINQVMNNLVINAEQAMPNGGSLRIKAWNVCLESDDQALKLKGGDYVCVAVQDQGIGIRPENLKRVFEPYFTTKPNGHGLGLASVYSIIKRHGGAMTVESELGKGTEFKFLLPAVRRAVINEEPALDVCLTGSGRVLVMDDDPMIQECAMELLAELGYESVVVADGDAACREFEKAAHSNQLYDAVILDLTIPGGMGGKDAIAKLREYNPRLKAIVSSGYSVDPVMARPAEYGFDAVLRKPFTIESLATVLNTLLSQPLQ